MVAFAATVLGICVQFCLIWLCVLCTCLHYFVLSLSWFDMFGFLLLGCLLRLCVASLGCFDVFNVICVFDLFSVA